MTISALFTGLSGLRAAQVGLDVASNNVANAHSTGYTRQRVDLVASPTWRHPSGPIGTGVTVDTVSRLRDAGVDRQFRQASAEASSKAALAASLRALESHLAAAPAPGIESTLHAFWEASAAWANDPGDASARGLVLVALDAVASDVRQLAAAWDGVVEQAVEDRAQTVEEVDRLIDELIDLDRTLSTVAPDQMPAELADRRDLVLDEIAALTGANARIGQDGRAEVLFGTAALVAAGERGTLEIVGGDIEVSPADGSAPATVAAGGRLGALHGLVENELPTWRGAVEDLAVQLAGDINGVNADGLTIDGQPGAALLEFGDPADPAGSLQLAVARTDVGALAAAAGGSTPGVGDGRNAERMSRLGSEPFVDPAGPSLDDRFVELVAGLGARINVAQRGADNAAGAASAAGLARTGQHAVSIDEEMVDLVRYQRALEAASRVMTTVDQALDVLVNRTGVVGR